MSDDKPRPKRYIAARRDHGIRITPDGTVYQDTGHGWRKVGHVRPDKDRHTLDQALGRR